MPEHELSLALRLSRDEARWLRKVVSHIGRRYDDSEARVLHDRLDRLINPQDYEPVEPVLRTTCPADGCPGLEWHEGRPIGCGHPTKVGNCKGTSTAPYLTWSRPVGA